MTTIVVAIDFSPVMDSVLSAAALLARQKPSRIVVIHVFQMPIFLGAYVPVVDRAAIAAEQNTKERLEKIRMNFQIDGIEATARLLFGEPGPAIIGEAKSQNATYIVLGAQGHGLLWHLLLGSTTVNVLNHASCPVVVMPTGGRATPEPELQETGSTSWDGEPAQSNLPFTSQIKAVASRVPVSSWRVK